MNDAAAPALTNVGELDRRTFKRNHVAPALEELRPISEYEGLYSVTADGRVWSHPRSWIGGQGRRISHKGFWLYQSLNEGYPQVTLTKNGKALPRKVHRLVALAWIPNPDELPEVNHIDGVKENCVVDNLEWCTRLHNIKHAHAAGLMRRTPAMDAHSARNVRAAARRARKVSLEQANVIRARVAAGEQKSAVGRDYGLTYWSVRDICKGETYAD